MGRPMASHPYHLPKQGAPQSIDVGLGKGISDYRMKTKWMGTPQEQFRDFGELFDSFHPHPYQRNTSKEAWDSVLNSGWASKMAKLAYCVLYEKGPLTLLELEHEAAKQSSLAPVGRSESTVIRRLYDLRDNGLVSLSITRRCNISGKNAVTWDVTSSVAPPEKMERAKCPYCGK